jgi:NADH:ubiquinone oxidoreductase subunit 2 (subunit N)
MSVLPFLVVTVASGSLSLFLRREARLSAAIGAVGLLAALVAVSTIRPEPATVVAGVGLAGSELVRLFLGLAAAAGLALVVVAAATTWLASLPGATLLTLGGVALALATSDVPTAVAAVTAAAIAGILAALPGRAVAGALPVAAWELRAFVVAGSLAIVAPAVVAGTGDRIDGPILGLAYLALAGATAIRLGAIPFHLRAARVADRAPDVALPLVMAWAPAAFALVALGWVGAAVSPLGEPLPAERAIVLLTAGASILLGTGAALLHDDLEHVVAYSIVADAGVALLALAAVDPPAAEPARAWLLAFVVSKSALAAWAAAAHGAYGRNRLGELSGWARRAPLLGLALAAVAVAGIGWPGMAVFEARRDLVALAIGGPLGLLLLVGSLASIAIYARLLAVGLATPGSTVRGAAPWIPEKAPPLTRQLRSAVPDAVALWTAYRGLVATAAVLALAALAVAIGGGGLGAAAASAAG